MRKAAVISTFSIVFIISTLLFETKALVKVYLKYGYCYEDGPFKNMTYLIDEVEKRLPIDSKEIMALKKQLCK